MVHLLEGHFGSLCSCSSGNFRCGVHHCRASVVVDHGRGSLTGVLVGVVVVLVGAVVVGRGACRCLTVEVRNSCLHGQSLDAHESHHLDELFNRVADVADLCLGLFCYMAYHVYCVGPRDNNLVCLVLSEVGFFIPGGGGFC